MERVSDSDGPMEVVSPGGNGKRFYYHHPDAKLDEILLVTHSVTLLHLSPVETTPPWPIPVRSALIFALIKNQASPNHNVGSHGEWLPVPELLGLYLVFRAASRSALSYFTNWYKESMSKTFRLILTLRKAVRDEQLLRERNGCSCMDCQVPWLVDGWTCPWSRFARERPLRQSTIGGWQLASPW